MEKELNDFKIEVLTQLAVINSKLDGYNKTQEIAVNAENRSKQNEQELKEIKQELKATGERVKTIEEKPAKKWDNVTGTVLGTIAGAIVGSIMTLIFK